MAVAVVQQVNALRADVTHATLTATVAATSTANLLVCIVINGGQNQVGVTDNGGNTWTLQQSVSVDVAHCHIGVYTTTVANPASITTVTATIAVNDELALAFFEVSGANNTAPIDGFAGAVPGGGQPNSGASGVPTTSIDLALGMAACQQAGLTNPTATFTSGAGTNTFINGLISNGYFSMVAGSLVLASAAAQTYSVTGYTGTLSSNGAAVVLIKPPATGTPPTFTASSPPATGTVGAAYPSYQFAASGTATITFAVSAGSLPPGLTLASNGLLSGTPTNPGFSQFQVTATNAAGSATTATLTITVSGGGGGGGGGASWPSGGTWPPSGSGSSTSGPLAQSTVLDTTYTFALTDANTLVRFANTGAVTATIPPNATVAFPLGTILIVYAPGAGGVTVAAGAGVTIQNNTAPLIQYEEASFRQDTIDTWVRVG